MLMYICQTPPCFQFTKKLNNWNSEMVYLVVCGCLLGVCVCLLVICGGLWLFVVVCWWFVVVCGGLWSFMVVTCFSNYD